MTFEYFLMENRVFLSKPKLSCEGLLDQYPLISKGKREFSSKNAQKSRFFEVHEFFIIEIIYFDRKKAKSGLVWRIFYDASLTHHTTVLPPLEITDLAAATLTHTEHTVLDRYKDRYCPAD